MSQNNNDVNDFSSFQDMVAQHRLVLKSLIDKDGMYKGAEAKEINNGFGKQIAFLNILLESYKLLGVKPEKKDLWLK